MKPPSEIPNWRDYLRYALDFKNRGIPQAHVKCLQKLKNQGVEPKVIYDIGSALGHWRMVAEPIWPDARFFLFEANEDLEFLYDHFGWSDYCIALLSDSEKPLRYYYNEAFVGGNSYYIEDSNTFSDERYRLLRSRTLDSVVRDNSWPCPDLVKIDVQGAELDILKGARKTLENTEWLIVELQHTQYNKGANLASESIPVIESMGWELVKAKFASSDPNMETDADYLFRKRSQG